MTLKKKDKLNSQIEIIIFYVLIHFVTTKPHHISLHQVIFLLNIFFFVLYLKKKVCAYIITIYTKKNFKNVLDWRHQTSIYALFMYVYIFISSCFICFFCF